MAYPKPKKTEGNLLLQLRMVEHRRLREIEEVSILNQSPKRVSLRGLVKPAISADALVPESERLRVCRLMATSVPYILEHPVIAYGSGHRGISYVTDPGS